MFQPNLTALIAKPSHLQPLLGIVPPARPGTINEMAKLVQFRASDDAAYITGEDYVIDDSLVFGAAFRRVKQKTERLERDMQAS